MNRPPPLVPGEILWQCDAVRVGDDGRVIEQIDFDAAALAALNENAKRLYLEVVERGDGGVWLIHRGGWPFAMNTRDFDPVGHRAAELRPRGAGDEVFRDLIKSFEERNPRRSLHVRAVEGPA